jgi:hypothetical protein
MGAAPGEESAVLGGELGERHRVVEASRETIGRREGFGEADLPGIVEIDQAGVERGIEMRSQQQTIVDTESLGIDLAQGPGLDVARAQEQRLGAAGDSTAAAPVMSSDKPTS